MKTFNDLGVPRNITAALHKRGISSPFPIQAATIADAIAGRDIAGKAPTGSGKTLAFSIPLAMRVAKGAARRPRALVLVPTRELAAQVCDTLRPLAQASDRSVAAFYGGTSIGKDIERLRRGVDIVVACPGRLTDLIQRRAVALDAVGMVVIDEADRMADMGFLPEVRRLLDQTTADRQTLLFSATLDGDVDVLVRAYQRNPARHEMAPSADSQSDVRHLFWHTEPHQRIELTRDIVQTMRSAIVFTRTKHGADRVAKQLARKGVTAAAIHGNRSQKQRERALADFMSGKVATLVATDVAARGIHVDSVGVVVHFDPPASDKDYVHRSGRTGRAGADGVVVTLVAPDRMGDVRGLQRALSMPQTVVAAQMAHLTSAEIPAAKPRLQPAGTPRAASGQRPSRPGRSRGHRSSSGSQRRGSSRPRS